MLYIQIMPSTESWINPLTPRSDWHLISPYNITPASHSKVMRIKGTKYSLD